MLSKGRGIMDYMQYTDINVNPPLLLNMGFNQEEINHFQYILNNGGKFTPQALQSYGYTYQQAQRLGYIYKICTGKVQVESKESKIRHLRKMFGADYRISIQDLAVSKVTDIPRVAVVSGITESPYNIWNSSNYQGKNALYRVIDVTGQKITVETAKKPRLEYKAPKTIPGVLEIKGVKQNGNAVVTFDKKVCRLCNRFIIVASLKNPEFHLGKYEILCFEGTRVYVYATNMGTKESVSYKMGNQRVYDYGIFAQDIKGKLEKVARGLYQTLNGVEVEYLDRNMDYKVVPVEQHDNLNEQDADL